MFFAITISILGVLKFLLACAAVVGLVLGLRWLAGIAGINVPPPVWALLGFVLVILLLIFAFSGGSVSLA